MSLSFEVRYNFTSKCSTTKRHTIFELTSELPDSSSKSRVEYIQSKRLMCKATPVVQHPARPSASSSSRHWQSGSTLLLASQSGADRA